jgi:hypothetical protein
MNFTEAQATEIRVEVRDGLSGRFLSERLKREASVAVTGDHTWEVRIDADGAAEDG